MLLSVLSSLFCLSTQSWAQVPSPAQELRIQKEEKKYSGQMVFSLLGRRVDDPFVNSRWSRGIIKGGFDGKYEEWLTGRLVVTQLMTSGASSYQMGVTEAGPSSGTFAEEVSLTLQPTKQFKASGGILNVEFNSIFSQHFQQSQPGGRLSFEQKNSQSWGETEWSLSGSQTIPGSGGSNNGSVILDEGTSPLLTLATLATGVKNEDRGSEFKLSATHYEYTDLSTSAATNSLRIGSTVSGSKDFQFVYQYRGKEYAAALTQDIGLSHEVEIKASTLSNELAPKNLRDGWQARLSYTRKFDRWEITPSIVQFRIEGDALPAVYSLSSVGYTNREGIGAGLKVSFPKSNANIFAGYTNTKALYKSEEFITPASTYQGDREIFSLGAEVKYDIF